MLKALVWFLSIFLFFFCSSFVFIVLSQVPGRRGTILQVKDAKNKRFEVAPPFPTFMASESEEQLPDFEEASLSQPYILRNQVVGVSTRADGIVARLTPDLSDSCIQSKTLEKENLTPPKAKHGPITLKNTRIHLLLNPNRYETNKHKPVYSLTHFCSC